MDTPSLGVTSIYLQGIDNAEIIDTVHSRKPPMISANAGLHLSEPRRTELIFGGQLPHPAGPFN